MARRLEEGGTAKVRISAMPARLDQTRIAGPQLPQKTLSGMA
jgi:hypothetical protein